MRGLLTGLNITFWYLAITQISLGGAITVHNTSPIWGVLLEKYMFDSNSIYWSHYIVILLCIIGVVCISQPSFLIDYINPNSDKDDYTTNETIIGYSSAVLSGLFQALSFAAMRKFVMTEAEYTYTYPKSTNENGNGNDTNSRTSKTNESIEMDENHGGIPAQDLEEENGGNDNYSYSYDDGTTSSSNSSNSTSDSNNDSNKNDTRIVFAAMYVIPVNFTMLGVLGSFIVYGEFFYQSVNANDFDYEAFMYAIFVGCISVFAMFFLNYSLGPGKVNVNEMSLIALTEVIWGYVFQILFLNQTVDSWDIVGFVFIIIPVGVMFVYNIYSQ